jgi:glucose/arabinose dehydrogenase
MKNLILFAFLLIAFLSIMSCGDKQETEAPVDIAKDLDPVDVVLDTLTSALSAPWGIEFVEDGILITDKSGDLLLWNDSSITTVSGTPTFRRVGQGGLLDVCKHPNFANNKVIYLCGSAGPSDNQVSTTLFSGVLNGSTLTNVEQLFQANPQNASGAHFGSRITFDNDGYLYLTLGERYDLQSAQDLSNHNGTVIRLRDDGSVPDNNPFIANSSAQPEIFSYGHRNVQGIVKHPITGEIWTHEHGPRGGDEINILKPGANYGWPLATFGIDYNGGTISNDTFVEGTERPLYYWVPSIAPCGMDFYYSDSIPQWNGSLFIGALVGQHLNRLTIDNNQVMNEERLLQNMARFRDVKQGPDGYLYAITERPGLLLRFRPKS